MRTRNTEPLGLVTIAILAVAGLLAGCREPSPDFIGYRHIGTEVKTDLASGVRKRFDLWEYDNGAITQSSVIVYLPQGNRIQRGTKLAHR
jgi:hypothetical protein